MDSQDLNRRAFGKLAAAALGGLVAGAGLVGAADKDKPSDKDKPAADKDKPVKDKPDETPKAKDKDKPLMSQEPHICRGLNTCKGKGHGGKNDCAGQGDCATAKAHTCAGSNDCAGLGGCNSDVKLPGENKCKTKGGCNVPTKDSKTWALARKSFEADMKKAFPDKKIGDAPKPSADKDK